jgi:hypothetical protein
MSSHKKFENAALSADVVKIYLDILKGLLCPFFIALVYDDFADKLCLHQIKLKHDFTLPLFFGF